LFACNEPPLSLRVPFIPGLEREICIVYRVATALARGFLENKKYRLIVLEVSRGREGGER
jgi:hypothetical protein